MPGVRVFIRKTRCSTCIFRPGNLMMLNDGRVEGMVAEADATNGYIPCHQTFDWGPDPVEDDEDEWGDSDPTYPVVDGPHAICKGYADRRSSMLVRMAFALDSVFFTDEDVSGSEE